MRRKDLAEEKLPGAWQTRTATAAGMLWLGLFPLVSDFSYRTITRSKWIAMWIGLGLCLPLLLFYVKDARTRSLSADKKTLRALGCWVGVMGLAAVFGFWAGKTGSDGLPLTISGIEARYEGFPTLLAYGLIALCLAARPVKLSLVSAAAAVGLTAFCAVTALQYAGGNPLGLYPEKLSIHTNYEFQGTVGNIDMVTGYLALVVPLTLLPLLRGADLWRTLCAAAGLAGVFMMLCTGVQAGYAALAVLALALVYAGLTRPRIRPRAAALLAALACTVLLRLCLRLPWLGESETLCLRLPVGRRALCLLLAAVVFALLAVCARFAGPGPRVRRSLAAGLIAFAVLGAVLAVALLPVPESAGGLWEIHETLCGRARDSFGSERIGIWKAALAVTRAHPLLGAGPGTFLRAGRDALAREGIVLRQTFDTAHSLWFDLAATGGVAGLLAFLGLTVRLLGRCLRGGSDGRVLAVCILAWLAQGCFTFSICIVSPMAWAVFGMAAGLPLRTADRRDES